MTAPVPHQGFPSAEVLNKARALVELAQSNQRALASLRDLDCFCEAIELPVLVEDRGVVFSPCEESDFDQGLSGFLGKYLLRVAQAAPARTNPALATHETPSRTELAQSPLSLTPATPPLLVKTRNEPVHVPSDPTLGQNPTLDQSLPMTHPAPAAFEPVSILKNHTNREDSLSSKPGGSATPAAQQTEFDYDGEDYEGADFDPDSDGFDEVPTSTRPSHPLSPSHVPTPVIPPSAPMSMDQIKALMRTGASLAQVADPFESQLAQVVHDALEGGVDGSKIAFCKRQSWDTWGGQAKRSARAAAIAKGLRHEHEPQGGASGTHGVTVLATFCIDPGPLPLPGSEAALDDPDLESLVLDRLRTALDSVDMRAKNFPARALLLCGWGQRTPLALDEARARGWSTTSLD